MQCMAHTQPLTDYFLSDYYMCELRHFLQFLLRLLSPSPLFLLPEVHSRLSRVCVSVKGVVEFSRVLLYCTSTIRFLIGKSRPNFSNASQEDAEDY